MSLKFALLGLIALKPSSGYDIKRIIDRSIYFVWNVTGPQIYNTLRILRDEGLVAAEAVAQKGKPDKQIHTITPKGEAALQEFANEPVRASITRDDVLLRIFFGNFADEAVLVRELGAYLDRIRSESAFMEATEARIQAHPGTRHKAREFQLLSLRLKVAQYRAMEQELVKFLRARAGGTAAARRRGSASAAGALEEKRTPWLVHPAAPPQRKARR
jgi:DNA-binding PadR family transcriptional regulator